VELRAHRTILPGHRMARHVSDVGALEAQARAVRRVDLEVGALVELMRTCDSGTLRRCAVEALERLDDLDRLELLLLTALVVDELGERNRKGG
jgi:hypothetical protein